MAASLHRTRVLPRAAAAARTRCSQGRLRPNQAAQPGSAPTGDTRPASGSRAVQPQALQPASGAGEQLRKHVTAHFVRSPSRRAFRFVAGL